jgi:hypothetical protein
MHDEAASENLNYSSYLLALFFLPKSFSFIETQFYLFHFRIPMILNVFV